MYQSIMLHISTAPAVAPAIMERIALGYQSLVAIFVVLQAKATFFLFSVVVAMIIYNGTVL
jgi:hypothetical protein